jgi:type I restriction enzyme M protein
MLIQDAAIQISRLLRDAKVEPPLRPRALASLVLAAAQGHLNGDGAPSLSRINEGVAAALRTVALPAAQRRRLLDVLRLGGADFQRLAPFLPAISSVLTAIDVAGLLRRDFDFLGIFYESFLRYGYDNNALGIVFTPRHITRFCVDLVQVGPHDRVIDIACGTGGFLVPAYERLLQHAATFGRHPAAAVCGFDTNPTVWALAQLNMLFRHGVAVPAATGTTDHVQPQALGAENAAHGDSRFTLPLEPRPLQESLFSGGGRDRTLADLPVTIRIELGSCFEALRRGNVRRRFTRAFLNPPFSQDAEPERDFIDAAMETLAPGGRCAAVVKAGIFADEEHVAWRAEFLRRHTLMAVISLPEDLFYPTAAPTSIVVACAHVPQSESAPALMARVWNDGFEKLKNKRVERTGSDLPEVKRAFDAMLAGRAVVAPLAVTLNGAQLSQGAEWSPQEWLPQPNAAADHLRREQQAEVAAVFRTVVEFPELTRIALEDFTRAWHKLPPLKLGQKARLDSFFFVLNGRSAGEKHYGEGSLPYVSSGGRTNSIVRLVECEGDEVFADGGITVTAFGNAALQPWPFLARGNGGSSVRVLLPRYRVGWRDLLWFAAQINAQQWRFFYARMAIKSRLERLVVSSPPPPQAECTFDLAARIREFRRHLVEASRID